jgi:hypothetical protein
MPAYNSAAAWLAVQIRYPLDLARHPVPLRLAAGIK